MILFKDKLVDFQHKDERGCLTQLVHDGFRQINFLESNKGARRGAHYHKNSREAFYVISGSVEVLFWRGSEKEKKVFKQGDFFEVYPYVVHDMTFLEHTMMIQMYDRPVVGVDSVMDIYSEERMI